MECRLSHSAGPWSCQIKIRIEYDGTQRRLAVEERLAAGDEIQGPAVIAEHTATTVIHAADRLRVGDHGEMTISVGTEGKA